MKGRQSRGRSLTRAINHIEDPPTEVVDRRSEAEPTGGQGWDLDVDDKLIAAYERGRQAERRDATPEIHEGAPEDIRRWYDFFTRLNPPRFDGTSEYAVAEEWLVSMNAKLLLCRTPNEDKMELAEQQLKSDTRFWWNGGPSTARPPPRQIATPVLQPKFVSRWCRSCNQAHAELEC